MIERVKRCVTCECYLPLADFHKSKNNMDGLQSNCKKCVKQWFTLNKEKRAKHSKTYYRKNKNSDKRIRCVRNSYLKRKFGITVGEYDKMLEEQGGVCAICGQPEIIEDKFGLRRLAVDHDHKTGKVRGLLCYKCNTLLGKADDNVSILAKAVSYILNGRVR